ncbi:MAG: T9SS type A sorting domain-containing protein [Calditrichaceae bacterium]|nr:T9SS type A sorting domain-containing protein [Calditrichaceae bacterium]
MDDAYPNPFNPVTNIALKLPESGHVKLEVFNIRGQRVATLMNGYCEAGVHEFSFDGRNLASGVYFYRVTAPKFTAVKRMLLLK